MIRRSLVKDDKPCIIITTNNNITNGYVYINDKQWKANYSANTPTKTYITEPITSCSGLLGNTNSSIISLDISKLDLSNCTDMRTMFYRNSTLTNIELGKFDTSKVTSIWSMFELANFSGVQTILDKMNTSQVQNAYRAFYKCDQEFLDLSNWDLKSVTNMRYMFCESSIKSIPTLKNTTNNTSLNCTFSQCANLSGSIKINFSTSSCTQMSEMFGYCKSIQELDLSSCDLSKITNISGCFRGCTNLTSIKLPKVGEDKVNWTVAFDGCRNLKYIDFSNSQTPYTSLEMFSEVPQGLTIRCTEEFKSYIETHKTSIYAPANITYEII